MPPIIQIQIGQCGNQVGTEFWKTILDEHHLNEMGFYEGTSDTDLDKVNVFFDETPNGKFIPRSVLVDLEPTTLDSIRVGPCGRLFAPTSFVCGQDGSGNNWVNGYRHNSIGVEALEALRRELEKCDGKADIQIVQGIGGGTGSGLGTYCLDHLSEFVPSQIVTNFAVFPGSEISQSIVESYNSVFSVHSMIQRSKGVFVFDNDQLYRRAVKKLGIQMPTFSDLNSYIAQCMAGITSPLRFPAQISTSMRKIISNLVLEEELHFFVCSQCGVAANGFEPSPDEGLEGFMAEAWNVNNLMASCNLNAGRIVSALGTFRGDLRYPEVETALCLYERRHSWKFCTMPELHMSANVCEVPQRGMSKSATLVINTSAIQPYIERFMKLTEELHTRHAFTHWYGTEDIQGYGFEDVNSSVGQLGHKYMVYDYPYEEEED
jgi:tubulin beta